MEVGSHNKINNLTDEESLILNINMSKEEIIKYIREYDPFFLDAHLENYPYHELMIIRISIDVERSKEADYEPMKSLVNAG